ncbi:hypothetical protein CE143_18920 [Photorhabdus luminescens]|uniref:Uncharacterized protein n=1 Tax=Photorhabdus akhurstii TaxID=171438 RepID=A0ABX8LYT1_9GAMM|nr:hypothetical protein [Photorhabdus akhurstii]KGM28560.1 hypothetical protein KS18_09005 [Photorhabdus luminescens]PQQ42731.1 hypothetical protein C6H65_01660 [Photorhabdus luminescens]QXF35005.1 hypothetical protein B0X70_18885 [Photorhabdus akhurstii]UJD76831.1 hypothetical protein CE143_18920 [Photorhabdus luminescens]
MKKFILVALLLGFASAANASSGDDKSAPPTIPITTQDCIAKWNVSSAAQSCSASVSKAGERSCTVSAKCRALNGKLINNYKIYPYANMSQLSNCNGYLKIDGC